ncbi:carbon starvation protein CstA [Enterobacter hormaechei]|nr:carbon starvation protein CstA [Enterobacter hormaechei]
MNNSGKYLTWAVLSVVGAFALGYIALNRGEQINALWIVVASVCIYLIAYRFYGRYIAKTVLGVDGTRMTPAVRHNDGLDYVPTDKKVLFGHHFAAIAGAGPLVGPVLAAQMGYLPGMIWILAGVVLAGAVQDFMVLFVSTRRDGRSLGELVKEEMGATAGVIALVATFMIMVIIPRGAGDDRGESLDPQPVGNLHRRLYHSAGAVYGDLHSLPASGTYW